MYSIMSSSVHCQYKYDRGVFSLVVCDGYFPGPDSSERSPHQYRGCHLYGHLTKILGVSTIENIHYSIE